MGPDRHISQYQGEVWILRRPNWCKLNADPAFKIGMQWLMVECLVSSFEKGLVIFGRLILWRKVQWRLVHT